MSVLLGIVAALIVCYICYKWYENLQIRQKLSWVPSNPGWPLLGNAMEFGDSSTLNDDIQKMIAEKKEKMVLVNVGFRSTVYTTDYDLTEFMLSSKDLIAKSDDYDPLKNWLGLGLLISDGPKWKSRRRILTPAFHFSILEQFVDIFEANGQILIEKLEKSGEQSIDIFSYILRFALDVICETAMGVQMNCQQDTNSKYLKNIQLVSEITQKRMTSVIKSNDFIYRLTPDYYREINAIKEIDAVTSGVIDKKRSKLTVDKKEEVDEWGRKKKMAFLDILLQCTENGMPLSNESIREEVNTFMVAGQDTTTSSLSFCIYLLSRHPDVQKRALEEQKEIFEDDIHRSCTYKDLQEMKYLECIIKESLRIYPPATIVARKLTEDVQYKGNLLPKGAGIGIFIYGIHHDPENYSDPEKFDPSRFEDASKKKPYQFIPFSAGPRNCLGQKFAMLEMKCTLSKLLRHFEIFPDPEFKLSMVTEFIFRAANGVNVKLAQRKW